MKTGLRFGIMLFSVLGILSGARSAPEAPQQIQIETKFVELTTQGAATLALPAPLDGARKVPGIVGTLTDPEFQTIVRTLSQRKGVDLLSAPRVTAKDGQQATVEVTREFAYKNEAGKPVIKNPGVTFTALPKLKGENRIALDLSPQVMEFERYVEHKSGWKEPVFQKRKAKASVVMTSGQTTVLEMESRTDQQLVQDTDWKGKITSSETVLYHRRLFVFVTASLVKPKP